MKNSQKTIEDAIYNNFDISQLKEAFETGGEVDNDQGGGKKNTFYSFTNQIRNQKHKNKELNKANIKEFFGLLLENGLKLGKEDLRRLNESAMSEELNQVMNDRKKGFVMKRIDHFETIINNSKDDKKGGHER